MTFPDMLSVQQYQCLRITPQFSIQAMMKWIIDLHSSLIDQMYAIGSEQIYSMNIVKIKFMYVGLTTRLRQCDCLLSYIDGADFI